MSHPEVRMDAVDLRYPCGTMALRGVDLHVPSGASFGIVGPNGAGKSTLLNLLCGFSVATAGTIRIGGETLATRSLDRIRERLGVLFQNADDQLFQSRVIDDVGFGLRNRGVPQEQAESRSHEILSRFGLAALASKSPFQLSSGQKRFVALCGVLVTEPQVLLLDEPTSDLDPRNRRKFLETFRSLSMTRIVISHDLDFVLDACDFVAILDHGRMVARGPSQELLTSEALLRSHHLELPLRLQGR